MASNTLPEQPGTPAADRASKRILIVDDDEVTRKVTEWKLQTAGYRVSTAADGSQAAKRLSHVGICDYAAPVPGNSGRDCTGGGGIETFERQMGYLRFEKRIGGKSYEPSSFPAAAR